MDLYEKGWEKWTDIKKYGPTSCHTRKIICNVLKPLNLESVLVSVVAMGFF